MRMDDDKRIVITGMGVVSPLGNSIPEVWSALLNGESGVSSVADQLGPKYVSTIAGTVKSFDPVALFGRRDAGRMARFTQFAVAAARAAVADAGLSTAGYAPDRMSAIIGVGLGGLECLHEASITVHTRGPNKVSPFGLPALIPNMAAGQVSIEVGACGPSYCVASACASSAHALGDSMELLRRGAVDVAVAGGAEACINALAFACFGQMRMLSTRNDAPTAASRPFEKSRDGIVLGEGGAVLILERYGAAKARGAQIYAELAGCGRSADSHHPVRPHPEGKGAAAAMTLALADAQVPVEDLGYVNAHGTSAGESDLAETLALKRLLGARAQDVWVSSTKSMTGHMLGASGAFEAIVTALTLKHGAVPPTINLDEPDPRCDLDYVPHVARELSHRVAVSNSFGFGGQNAALVFKSV